MKKEGIVGTRLTSWLGTHITKSFFGKMPEASSIVLLYKLPSCDRAWEMCYSFFFAYVIRAGCTCVMSIFGAIM